MSEQHNWGTIKKNQTKLRDDYGVDDDKLLEALVSKDLFLSLEEKAIRKLTDPIKRFDKIFEILCTKDPIKFQPIFIASLKEVNYGAATFLQGNPRNVKITTFSKVTQQNGYGLSSPLPIADLIPHTSHPSHTSLKSER